MQARIPLLLTPQPEGGYTVTSPLFQELLTEGDTVSEALANAEGAFGCFAQARHSDESRNPDGACCCCQNELLTLNPL